MKRDQRQKYFPVLINMREFPCLVIGGGKVALRKVSDLLRYQAKITIVSPQLSRQLLKIAARNKITVIKKIYSSKYLKNYKMVFCTTNNPETNKLVQMDCRRKGILLNTADQPSMCDFILPANLIRGDLIISTSSQGKAPFYSKYVRDKLKTFVPPYTKQIIELAADFRKQLLANSHSISTSVRKKAYREFLSTNWEDLLATRGKRATYEHMRGILKKLEKNKMARSYEQ
ncbi:MAG: precorrin-2 dehydrogenase/sirohydrochlorin ferrochelatase family protein [Candidatus Kryptoniota bacterium]